MERGDDLPEALRYGSVAGALACTVAGAQPGLPLRAAIEASLGNLEPAVPI
jgi:sugar/nucleoside kinase (ribokinase family)